jgi:hypothetical protein
MTVALRLTNAMATDIVINPFLIALSFGLVLRFVTALFAFVLLLPRHTSAMRQNQPTALVSKNQQIEKALKNQYFSCGVWGLVLS